MPDLEDLSGFDAVYAVSEHTINSQFALLAALSVMPTDWSASSSDGVTSISAELGTPVVSFDTGPQVGSRLQMRVPLTSGTFNWVSVAMKDGKPVAVPEQTDISGSALVFTSGLNLAQIASVDAASIPPDVQTQLSRFDASMLSINQLFLDLEDANVTTATLDTGGKVPISPTSQQQIDALVDEFVAGLRNSGNPYVLGYTALNRQPDPSAPTWMPTGMTFSLYPDATTPDISSVNHLMVTDGRPVPAQGGSFSSNWVPSPQVEGTFVIAPSLIMQNLLESLCQVIGQDVSIFSVTNGTQISGSFPNQIGGTTTCTVVPEAGQPSVQVLWHSTYRKEVHDEAGSDIGYVDGFMDQVTTIAFSVDSVSGTVTTAVSNSQPTGTQNKHPNALGQFEEVLAIFADVFLKIFSFGFAPNVFEDLVSNDWKTNLTDVTVGEAANLKDRIVLPAGGQLLFKDLRFYADGTLVLDATIAD